MHHNHIHCLPVIMEGLIPQADQDMKGNTVVMVTLLYSS